MYLEKKTFKDVITFKDATISWKADFSPEMMETKREQNNIWKKKMTSNLEFYIK